MHPRMSCVGFCQNSLSDSFRSPHLHSSNSWQIKNLNVRANAPTAGPAMVGPTNTCLCCIAVLCRAGPKRVSFEGVARGVSALRSLHMFAQSMSSVGSSGGGSVESLDEDETQAMKTAVLSRSSTVHRSLAVNSGAEILKR